MTLRHNRVLFVLSILLGIVSIQARAETITLNPPSGLLGVSCGGIHTNVIATGFDTNGHPTADVFAWTQCGGSGRGGGYHTTIYSVWHAVTWDLKGHVLGSVYLQTASPDPSLQYADRAGDSLLTSPIRTAYGAAWAAVLETP